MINVEELGARIILGFGEGKLFITESTLFGLVIAVILAVLGIWLGSGLKTVPKGKQILAEFIVGWVYKFTENNMGKENKSYAPYVGSILGFVFCASCLGLFGIRPITADLNVAFALRVHRNRTVAASDDAPKQHDYDGPVSACGYGTAAECDL